MLEQTVCVVHRDNETKHLTDKSDFRQAWHFYDVNLLIGQLKL